MAYDFARSLNDVLAGLTKVADGERKPMQEQKYYYVDPTNGKQYDLTTDNADIYGNGSTGTTYLNERGTYGTPAYQWDNNGTFRSQYTSQNPNTGGGLWDTVGKNFVVPAVAMAVGANALQGGGGFFDSFINPATAGADAVGGGMASMAEQSAINSALGSAGAAAGGVGAAAGAGGSGSVLGSLGGLGGAIKTAGGIGSILSGLGGGSSGGGNLSSIISGLYDYYKQNEASDKMLDYVKGAQQKIDDIYSPTSQYQKYMWDAMSAKDAAAGRNSQYGPRTQGFLGQYAKDYSTATANTTNTLSGMFQNGVNKGATAGTGLATGIGNNLQSLGNTVQNLSSYLSNYTPQQFQSNYGTALNNNYEQDYPYG